MKAIVILFCLFVYSSAAGVPGGWNDADPSSESVRDAAKFAMVHLNSQLNGEFGHKMIEIKKVRTQVVAGMNYDIELTSGVTDCKKEVVNDNCALTEGGAQQTCKIMVYSRPWENKMEITSFECRPLQ